MTDRFEYLLNRENLFEEPFRKLAGQVGEFEQYTSKWYGGRNSSEVLSKGFEYLLADPVAFHKADPELFEFMVRFLNGELMDIKSTLTPTQLKALRGWGDPATFEY